MFTTDTNMSLLEAIVSITSPSNFHDYNVLSLTRYISITLFAGVAVAASVFTITAMALDRYMAITQPFGFSRCFCFNKKTVIIIILSLWLASLLIFLPIVMVTQIITEDILSVTFTNCYENWTIMERYYPRRIFGIVCFMVMFAIPGELKRCGAYIVLLLWAWSTLQRLEILRDYVTLLCRHELRLNAQTNAIFV